MENGHFAFLRPLRGLGTTYDVHLGLIGRHNGLSISVNLTFFARCVTAEVLQANIE